MAKLDILGLFIFVQIRFYCLQNRGSDESMMVKVVMMGGVLSGKSTVVGAQLG